MRGAAAVSLVERQVLMLRDRNEKLESRLRELIEVARANDALSAKIHRLARAMIRAHDAQSFIDALKSAARGLLARPSG